MSESDPIDLALREDIGAGDVTTTLLVPDDSRAHARILPREKAIIAGTMTAAEVFRRVDPGFCGPQLAFTRKMMPTTTAITP